MSMKPANKEPVLGLIVPPASGRVPPEAHVIQPEGVRFVTRGIALGELTLEGYGAVIDRVATLAAELKEQEGADAVALMGTSLTFFRGSAFNDELLAILRETTGLPVTTMSTAIRDALNALGARRVAVGTAYTDEVDAKLREFLEDAGFEVVSMVNLGLTGVAEIHAVTQEAVVALGERAVAASGGRADAVLVSCGGLISSDLAPALEARVGLPVVASATAGVWAALRLVGIDADAPQLGALGRTGRG